MKKNYLLVLFTFITMSVSVMAQSSDNTAIHVYSEAQNTEEYAAGIIGGMDATDEVLLAGALALPAEFGHPDANFTAEVIIDEKNNYVVLHQILEAEGVSQSLRLYDDINHTCCVDIGALVNGEAFDVGSFDPDGKRFAFSYTVSTGANNPLPAGGIAIYDAEQGVITQNIAMADIITAINGPQFAVWANMGEWTEQGILFAPNCYACEGVFEGEYSLYNPDTNSFIAESGILFQDWYGKRLDATGEFLYVAYDERFSHDPTPGMFPVPNVILYNPTVITSPPTSGTVIFATDDMIALSKIEWINDGRAILAESTDKDYWVIRYRTSGKFQLVDHDREETVLAGLHNGWLSLAPQADGTSIFRFWNGITLTPTDIFTFGSVSGVHLVQSPALGETLTTVTAFPAIAPSGEVLVQCTGFLPSRLQVGEQARVVPGDPNNLRDNPGIGAQSIGQIPGGETFTVLMGPECDSAGYAWWQVDYNGTIGWTAEGSGNIYWLEPLH